VLPLLSLAHLLLLDLPQGGRMAGLAVHRCHEPGRRMGRYVRSMGRCVRSMGRHMRLLHMHAHLGRLEAPPPVSFN
jgi:hypothetical protein